MSFNTIIEKIVKKISGKNAKKYAIELSKYHRIQATKGFYEAAMVVKKYLTDFGYTVKLLEFPSDGEKKYFDWPSPIGWEIEYGYMDIIEPVKRRICDFSETPTSIIVHSGSTPEEGITGEVVYVGKGTEDKNYENVDVKGKFVLTFNKSLLDVHEEAVIKRGAIGVISYQENIDAPDAVPYRSFWSTAKEVKSMKPGFSISFNDARKILKWLEEGKTVKVSAKMKTNFYPSKLVVVTTKLEGIKNPEKEVIITSHLCHPNPGANDNASGSALAIELARVLKELINSKEIDPPGYSIRFLWIPEMFGTLAYVESMKINKKDVLATINLDMVGEDQCKCKSTLSVVNSPLSIPSFITALTQKLTKFVAEMDVKDFGDISGLSSFRFSFSPFIPGSDHYIFADSTFGIQSVAFIHWPDIFYHTSEDTTDKMDPFVTSRVGTIALALALILTLSKKEKLVWMLSLTFQYVTNFILDIETRILNEKNVHVRVALYKSLDKLLEWGMASIKNISEAYSEINMDDKINFYTDNLIQFVKNVKSRLTAFDNGLERATLSELEQKMVTIYPKRVVVGPLFDRKIRKELRKNLKNWIKKIEEKDKAFFSKTPELYNLMNGENSLYDIYAMLIAEYGNINLEDMKIYVDFLQKQRYVTLQQKN